MLQIPSFIKSLIPLVQKATIKEAKKKLIFHKLCKELNIQLHEDSFDFIYLQTLTIFLEDKHVDWAIIFDLKESREIFNECFNKRDFDEFERILDAHLHTTIKKGELKSLNEIPTGFVTKFKELFRELIYDNLTPVQSETINTIIEVGEKSENRFDNLDTGQNNMLEMIEKLSGQLNNVLNSGSTNANFEQIISDTHQFQIDQIKQTINQGNMVLAYNQLLALKDHIWPTASPENKLKTLNNIAFTLYHQNKPEDALAYYEEAIQILPDHAGTLAQLAGIYLSQHRVDDALAMADRLRPAKPGLIAAIELHRKSLAGEEFDPETGLSDTLATDTDVLVALINVSIKKYPRRTINYARTLLNQDVNSQSYQEIFIHVICHVLIGEQIDFNTTELRSEADSLLINEAADMLKALWRHFEHTDLKPHKLNILEKLGLIQAGISDNEGGLATADLMLSISPGHYNASKFRGMSLSYLHRFDDAIKQFEELPDEDVHAFDYINVWALCLAQSGRYEQAFKLLNEHLLTDEEKKGDHDRVRFMLQYLYRQGGFYNEALSVQKTILKDNPENIAVLADRAKTFGDLNKPNEVKTTVKRLIKLVKDPNKSFTGKERYIAAHYLYTIGKFQDAADILENFVDVNKNHFLTYQLADSYVQSGRKGLALTIYRNLREKYGVGKEYSRKEADIYLHYHDYEAYEKLMENYVTTYPDDFSARLNLNSAHVRLSRKHKVEDFYSNLPDTDKVSLEEIKVLARQMHISNYREAAQNILYNYRRKNPGGHINDFYISFCLEKPNEAKDYSVTIVEADTVVSLKAGDVVNHYKIENRPENELIKLSWEINLSDPIYLQLKGKKLGDTITSRHFFFGTTAEIIGLQHKFIYAFQEAGKENSTIYASQSAIKSFQFTDIANFHEIIQQQISGQPPIEKAFDELEAQYKLGIIPLTVFAHLTRQNPIEIFEYLIHRGIGIHCTVGHTKDYEDAIQLATRATTFVFDITSLLTLFSLDFAATQLSATARKVISNSTYDLIQEFVRQTESESQGPHISFFEIQGEKFRQQVTKEQKQNRLDKWKKFEAWVSNNFEMMPCRSLLENENEKHKRFIDMIGSPVFESALLAKELDGLWISDDTAARSLISGPYQSPAIWTQPLLKQLQLNGDINQIEYSICVNKLCLRNYHFTTINKDDIMICLEQNNYLVDTNVEACLKILSGRLSDYNSIRITFVVLQELQKINISSKQRYILIYYLFMVTIGYRYFRPTLETFRYFNSLFIQDFDYQDLIYKAIERLRADIYTRNIK